MKRQIGFLKKVVHILFYTLIFLLPLQTRKILFRAEINNGFWEWGTISLYLVELLFLVLISLAVYIYWDKLSNKDYLKKIWNQYQFVFLFFLLMEILILLSAFHSSIFILSLFFAWRLLEMFFLFWIIILLDFSFIKLNFVLISSAIIESALALYQWIEQRNPLISKILSLSKLDASKAGTAVIEYKSYAETRLGNGEFWSRWLRAYGTFPHPNILASFLLIALLIALGLYLYQKYGWGKLFSSLIATVIYTGLLLTFSRAVWLSFLILFIALIIFIYKLKAVNEQEKEWQGDQKFAIFKYIFLIFSITALFVLVYPNHFYTRTHLENRLEEYSYKDRLWQYKYAFSVISKYPLWGTGAYESTLYLPSHNVDLALTADGGPVALTNAANKYIRRNAYNFQPVHNLYLLIWEELGFFALLIFLAFIMYILALAWQNRKKYKDDIILFMYLLSFFAILITAFFDHYWWTIWSSMFLFYLIIFLFLKRLYLKTN